ncbi:MAG: thioredoxin family protein [Halobacteriaceae archaeon]
MLKERVEEVVEANEIDAEVTKVEDAAELAKRGVMSTPALAVDGDVKFAGTVPSEEEVLEELK